jgi:hypothetical protein
MVERRRRAGNWDLGEERERGISQRRQPAGAAGRWERDERKGKEKAWDSVCAIK